VGSDEGSSQSTLKIFPVGDIDAGGSLYSVHDFTSSQITPRLSDKPAETSDGVMKV
jgi:hypothetical protein